MVKNKKMKKIDDYLKIKDAAELLGVSANTLRNWEKLGKLKAHRNPNNKYRLYKKSDLEELLKNVGLTTKTENDWIDIKQQKPKSDCLVIVKNEKSGMRHIIAVYHERLEVFMLYDPNYYHSLVLDVTHWYPLPD